MIEWVHRAAWSNSVDQVSVAINNERIVEVLQSFGGEYCLISFDPETDTDRVVEVIQRMG